MPSPRRTTNQRSSLIHDLHEFDVLPDTREIFLTSNTADEVGFAMIDHWAATRFIKNLRVLVSISTKPILVHMITCGGDWNYGMAIYDAIMESCNSEAGAEVTVLAYAHSRSMSSIIPQAATRRVIMPNADFLIHFGSWGYNGTHRGGMSEADWARKIEERMLDIYADRCHEGQYWKRERMDKKAIKEWLKEQMDRRQEFYMTPREAVDKGFMDAVLGDEDYETIGMLLNEEPNGQKNGK